MLKFRIHYTIKNSNSADFIDIEWETIEEIKKITKKELADRGAEGQRSERI